MKNLLLGAFLLGTITMIGSCNTKKGRGSETENSTSEDSISKGLVVTLEGVFPTNDTYQLFYSNDDKFAEEKSIKIPVFGQSVIQKVVFELPADSKPQNLRLDYGVNADQKFISIKNVEFLYKENKLVASNTDFYGKFFVNGQGTTYNVTKLTIDFNINSDGVYDPFAISTAELKKGLNKIYSETKVK